ncbi:Uncharacterized protein APZ42_025134 [Daphnia magna]|uniref:Uncharacterized protein n=1 Tax=Daphnia magna TaxID=35525 RepID=A0A164TEY2_9CRUS|nr:Uncharacterized protein APZ42_025134 [Daphnia magna]
MSKRILEEYSKQYTFSRTTEKRKRSVHQDTLIQKKPRLDDVLLDVGVGPSTAAAEELTTTVAEASTAPLTRKGKNLHEYVMKWFKNTKQLVEKQIAYLPTDLNTAPQLCHREIMTPLPIMGVSLPMEVNGLRNHKRAVVTDIKSIIDVFEEFRRATLMLVVMALPLVDRLPPIRILSFCTDNKFTAEDVKARMHFIISAFAAEGILALVCSADADAHEMKFMRETEELGIPGGQEMLYSLKPTYFYFAAIRIGCGIPVQFPVHQANVNYIASPVHLQTLMNQHDKSRHLLKPEDLNVHCKMNYGSAERLGQLHVPQLLEYVEGSEATQFYLRLIYYSALSYVDQNLSLLERVYRMWYVVFSLRLWRYWITCDTAYTLAANFMTLNVYLCVEFNAHALVLMILSLKDNPEAFKPWLCTS